MCVLLANHGQSCAGLGLYRGQGSVLEGVEWGGMGDTHNKEGRAETIRPLLTQRSPIPSRLLGDPWASVSTRKRFSSLRRLAELVS